MVDSDERRRRFLKLSGALGVAGLTGLAGCSSGGGSGDDAAANIGMVYATGGLGDGSFNDQAQAGIQQAAEDFDIAYEESQPETNSEFQPTQRQYAQSGNYDLVSCIGYAQADALSTNAAAFPDQDWVIVDSVVDEPNVASYGFREHEGSFLVGYMAGMLTTRDFSAGAGSTSADTKTVGFVGGTETPLIQKFQAGFEAGVNHHDDSIEVVTSYVGSFNDPAAGQEQARSMYDSGADIVYHASGATGVGVFRAAQDMGKFAIGVDKDQSITQASFADVILASMVKRVDTAVYTAVESVVNDNFAGGEQTTFGLSDDGVEAVYGDQLGSQIPEDVKSTVADAREQIIAGDITVPSKPQ
ncbi:BMP family protein [Salarchaeum sp. JOR-1]|uniref:BMP family lipoprotein n=1 Tax=Salarchaeum sp. JOR-1 TaxID=2599399 RepID=UPI001198441E|nr:BMP family protein [Salarchaeum sp. JOR-1]QDX41325.1 BMP family ABC transporter substrate-binding protein [Salarchaeum sp. JOR-1]